MLFRGQLLLCISEKSGTLGALVTRVYTPAALLVPSVAFRMSLKH